MKKTYSTPDILFDSFSLNENIASNCTRNITNQYSGTCGLEWKGMMIFTTTATGCRNKVPDGSVDGICYHVPIGSNKVFNS